ncbi:MAG TPA: arginase family protein [Candidatus Hydrothermia bacterium]|nr:arginase family protein [Candidatus Hydrothermae bacterium]MDD3648852.1 arginase family protein [Candidatus Hydrothermia bacterium]MDD5572330.1 arginase family protein [Candidatus Hydrothermia bacterium]HOK23093.1 arginase family protein [Candidatus Hydrothermia bacterium]HOL23797.1 arginase family protein [Candidatus Hydrothermia bacterium]
MATIKVLGLPYEGVENFQPGAQLAPASIRWAYDSIELHSVYQAAAVPDFDDLGDFYFYSKEKPEKFIDDAGNLLKKQNIKPPFIALGGDHLITYPIIKYLSASGEKFKVIHLDAHLDRRDAFVGNRYSHASVVKRIEELIGEENVITLGYRSVYPEERPRRAEAFKVIEPLMRIVAEETIPLYLTLDFDVLNPSIFPAVSNPEPGGIDFLELMDAFKLLKGKVIAMDLVELNPLLDATHQSSVLAAEVFRESLILLSR